MTYFTPCLLWSLLDNVSVRRSIFPRFITFGWITPRGTRMTTTRAFMDTSEIPFLRYFDQRHFRFNVSFQQHFWNRNFFFHLSVSHNFNRLLRTLCKSQTLLLWDFILFLSFFWAFFFQSHNPCLFSYYDLFLDQFYHNFTITSIVFHSNIYPFYSRRFVTLFALFYFCSTKLNCYK